MRLIEAGSLVCGECGRPVGHLVMGSEVVVVDGAVVDLGTSLVMQRHACVPRPSHPPARSSPVLPSGNADALDILRWAIGRGRPRFSRKEARDNFRRRFAEHPERLASCLAWLEKHGCVFRLPPKQPPNPGRRPSPCFEVVPSVFETWAAETVSEGS
jgi:hypothetical protein